MAACIEVTQAQVWANIAAHKDNNLCVHVKIFTLRAKCDELDSEMADIVYYQNIFSMWTKRYSI